MDKITFPIVTYFLAFDAFIHWRQKAKVWVKYVNYILLRGQLFNINANTFLIVMHVYALHRGI